MGTRTKAPATQGPGKATDGVDAMLRSSDLAVVHTGQPEAPAPASTVAPTASVHGAPVTEFHALIGPAAFLITRDGGTHEITRCYYDGQHISLGYERRKLGGLDVLAADLDHERLRITFERGVTVEVPAHRVQATYRR